jgi:hypothetical protein
MRNGLLMAITLLGLGMSQQVSAQERLMFPDTEDVRAEIIRKINAENERIDISAWYLTERSISVALINRFKAGVTVRVLSDRVSIFEIDPRTRTEYEYLANAGIPIRLRYIPTSFPYINHWKAGIFVEQGIVEFGSANWTPFELYPSSLTNFKDETAMFTDDPALVNAFKTRFDEFWADTTNFLDWPEAYRRETGQTWVGAVPMEIDRTRLEGPPTNAPGMIWSQGSELTNAMTSAILKETNAIDFVIYRLSVPNITDALVNRIKAGVPVRIFVEPTQYRNIQWPEYWLTGTRVDQLWLAGAQIKQRTHDGLTHMKVLITSESALHGSSNFTKNWQRDHNYFIPSAQKPTLYWALRDKFDAMWNDTANYKDFYPKAPNAADQVSPVNGVGGVSATPTLRWEGAAWAVSYDVYLGTSSNNMTFQGRVNAVLNENPPATYSWTPSSPLQSGTTYYWRVVSRTFATDVDPTLNAPSLIWRFTTSGTSGGGGETGPYGGTPVSLPGTIQAENFDEGADGVAYHDTTSGNSGGKYRTTNVDIETTGDSSGSYNVGWTAVGEWLNYTVNVGTAGNYDLEFRIASSGGGGSFHVEANGVNKTGPIAIPNTGGWQKWVTVTKTGVSLGSGTQTWRLVIDSAGPTGAVGNFNFVNVKPAGSPPPPPPPGESQPYGGTPAPLPGKVEVENFDEGGQDVAYRDATTGNSGGKYRTTDVDIETTTDTGGGFNVGWTNVGEWLKYTVNVASAATYDIDVRVAANGSGGTFHIEVNGVDKTGPLTVPNTGGWQKWTTVTRTGVSLGSGQQVLRLVIDGAGPTGVIGNFNFIQVRTAGAPPPPPPDADEIVIYAADVPTANIKGNWVKVSDPSAAAGVRLASTDVDGATVGTPLASPTDYFDVTFNAVAGVKYRLWLRVNAQDDNKYNDSLYVQFSGAVNSAGSAIYRIGTTKGLNVNQALCSACVPAGWGWHNGAYWLSDSGEVWFNTTGTQTLRVQIREDGVRLDQIVLSPELYLTTRPGSQTNDTTIVPKP